MKTYIVYDRDDEDEGVILLATDDRAEAIDWAKENEGFVYEYEFNKKGEALNGKLIFN